MRSLRALGLMILAGTLAACGGGQAVPSTSQAELAGSPGLSVTDPPNFVMVTPSQTGLVTTVELRSPTTGRVVRVLGTFGQSFTNNGLALSPDSADVYVTLIGHRSLLIERISAVTKRRTLVAEGAQPALGPNGRFLAYASGGFSQSHQDLTVRDLSSGTTRTLDLTRLLGSSTELVNSTITWLGDGTEIVVMPAWDAVAAATAGTTPSTTQPPRRGTCSAVAHSATCLIIVHVVPGTALTASRLVLPFAIREMSGDDALLRALLFAGSDGRRALVARVDFVGSSTHIVRLLSLPPEFPIGFDPDGARLLYLVGHTPPALWIAGIKSGHLVNAHRLIANVRLGGEAW